MRRIRSAIGLLAILGVLLHAGLLARHNSIMLQSKLLQQELAVALGVICHSDGTLSQRPADPAEQLPAPADQSECPICMGMAAAAAVLPVFELPVISIDPASARVVAIAEVIRARTQGLSPPPRGPPSIT